MLNRRPMPLLPSEDVAAPAKPRRRIWIVGGGPSLKGFDFSILRSQFILTVNDACFALPWAAGVVSIDRTWICERARQAGLFAGQKFLGTREGMEHPAARWMFRSEPGLSEHWGVMHAVGTSGYAALNVAILLGARFVGLLGFDYTQPGRHWFPNYPWPSGAYAQFDQWAAGFDSTIPHLRQRRAAVVNFSPDSAITAFERRPLEDICEFC
jgi:hypothetical protein